MVLQSSRRTELSEDMSCPYALAQTLERRERARVGSVDRARRALADRLRIGVGTLEGLVRKRVKIVDVKIRDRLQALLVRELESEITRLSHELELARQGGAHLASIHISEIETHLAKATALLRGKGE